MAALYPSLEDLKIHQILEAQASAGARTPPTAPVGEEPNLPPGAAVPALYPDLAALEEHAGLRRAGGRPGLREIHLRKDERGDTGLRLRNVDQGLFVRLVEAGSPAALAGLRFGDQVLQLDGRSCAGWSSGRARRALRKASAEKLVLVVRDSPFQRTVTVHKDSAGRLGFVLKKGQIVSLAQDGSAARNSLLTRHRVCEVNGQDVVGLQDKQITEVLAVAGRAVTLAVIPAVIYKRVAKR